MRKILLPLLAIAASYIAYTFLSGSGSGTQMQQMGAMPVSVAETIERDTTEWDDFSGRLEAVDRVEIRSRVAGTIDKIHFNDGQIVKKGDLLVTIDPKPFQAALQAAKAKADYANAEITRAKILLPEKAISQREFDEKKNAADVANAELTKAKLDLGYSQIRAPISGRVSRAEITVGNLIGAGGEAPIITTIVSINPIYASFDVDEQSYVKYLKANEENPENLEKLPVKLSLSAGKDYTHEGKVKSFDNEINTGAGTVRVRALFENKTGTLIPGLFAHLRIGGSGQQKLLLINDRAVVTDQSKKLVYVVGAENKIEPREVRLGSQVDGLRVVRDGLKPGETIVVNGVQRAMPGSVVVPQVVAMDTLEAIQTQSPESQQPAANP